MKNLNYYLLQHIHNYTCCKGDYFYKKNAIYARYFGYPANEIENAIEELIDNNYIIKKLIKFKNNGKYITKVQFTVNYDVVNQHGILLI